MLKTWDDFEVAAVAHLRLLGFLDVERTPPGTTAVDARGERIVAQVKARSSKPSEQVVRVLHSVMVQEQVPLGAVYSLSGFPRTVPDLADACAIACFQLDEADNVVPVNQAARDLRAGAVPAASLLQPAPVTEAERTRNRVLVDRIGLDWDRMTGGTGEWVKHDGWRRSVRTWLARGLTPQAARSPDRGDSGP